MALPELEFNQDVAAHATPAPSQGTVFHVRKVMYRGRRCLVD